VAGPIVRSGDFLPQLERRKRFSWLRLQAGVRLFILGLIKKAVIADHIAAIIDPVFARPGQYGSSALWLATIGYALQIYGDFSGYSDMAIGLAHTLGFKLPANFRMPYFAASLSEFWTRWHISLSSWLRDYLYIPLGGNRGGKLATYRNLLLTMTLGGFWHGASWTFLLWGFYHGMLLVIQRLIRLPAALERGFRPVAVLLTFLSVCVGWVFFRAQSLADARVILHGLLGGVSGLALAPAEAQVVLACLAAMFLGHVFGTLGWPRKLEERLPAPIAGAGLAFALTLYFLLLPHNARAFIYFQF
jgi:alginate O-acetyltransferase complex protein AlgI